MLLWNDEKFDKHFSVMLFNQGDTCIAVCILWNRLATQVWRILLVILTCDNYGFKLSVLKQASFMWWWEMFWRQISLILMCAWLIFHTRYLHWVCLIYLLQCCDYVYTFSCFAVYISQISSPFVFKLLLHRPFFRYTYFLFVNSNTNAVYVWL